MLVRELIKAVFRSRKLRAGLERCKAKKKKEKKTEERKNKRNMRARGRHDSAGPVRDCLNSIAIEVPYSQRRCQRLLCVRRSYNVYEHRRNQTRAHM